MKLLIRYERENPDTIIGEKLTITHIYSSFNKDEIDEMEQKCKDAIGNGLMTELKGSD